MSARTDHIPIVLTAFGTTEKAFSTYEKMDRIFRKTFPENSIHWAYTSRMVKHALKKKKEMDLKDPLEMMQILAQQKHPWVVIQSLHLICGHEFDRLVAEKDRAGIRSSMGLPLLTSPEDYEKTIQALGHSFPRDPDRAVILVGHGTDHPAWSVYPSLEAMARKKYGEKVFVGVVEGFPDLDFTLEKVKKAGFTKACLIPLMLVAGVHFKEDLTGNEDSWQACFERDGIHGYRDRAGGRLLG